MAARSTRDNKRLVTLEVLRSEWLTPHLVRIVAGGPGLADFVDNEFTDRYVKIIFPRPGVDYPEPFDLDVIHERLPRPQWPALRSYTVRYVRPEAGELAIDFVYHGDEGLAGPWAAALKPGDEILFRGPGGAYAPQTGADWHLLAGDEAALPAIAAALERIPTGTPAWAFIEVADATEEQPLTCPGELTLRWLHRGSDPTLPDAVRSAAFPPGTGQAFVHGEAGMVRQLRTHLLDERGFDRQRLSVSGYWRRGMVDEDFRIAKKAEKAEDAAAELTGQRSR